MIRLVVITNPFQPAIARVVSTVEWRDGMTLASLLTAAGVPVACHCCVVEGLAVPPEMLAGFRVVDGSEIVAMPNVAGGGFGKMFAEIAVIVAATVVTGGLAAGPLAALGSTGFGSLLAGAGLGSLSTSAASLIGAGIAIGGNMLVNAFMGGAGGGGSSSDSFDPTGPKTVASGNVSIPKGYGTFSGGPNIIASYVTAEGADNYLNVLGCWGWGTAASVGDIRINNNSISNFVGATYMVRLGTNSQTPIPYFNNVVNGYPQALRCYSVLGDYQTGANVGTPVVIQGTGNKTQGLQVVMQFPGGIFYSNNDGSLRSLSVSYLVEYSVEGSGVWQVPVIPRTTHDLITYTDNGTVANAPGWVVVPTDGQFSSGVVYDHDNSTSPTAYTPGQPWTGTQTVTYYRADGSSYQGSITLNGEWQPCDPSLNQQIVYDWSGGFVIFTAANQGTLYHTTNIYNLPPAKYDVRISKYGSAFSGDALVNGEANNDRTGDQIWVHSINEVQYQDLSYPNMILVGVRALATNQVSGANLSLRAQVTYNLGVALPSELASFGADNPALVAYDMMVNTLYGGGIDPSLIDLPAWAAWAAFNDELVSDGFGGQIKRHVFNGIFDTQGTNLWASLRKVALLSNASIVQVGRNFTVVTDEPVTVPDQVFTMANISRDSLKDTWLSLDDRCNRIEVTFPDAGRDYRTDEPCAVMLPGDIQAGVEQKPTRLSLLGCTSRAQAWHWAYRKITTTDTLLLTRSFDAALSAVACQVGSVIGVQDDITQWSYGGRVQSGSTTQLLEVDVPELPFVAGNGWTVSVVHPVVIRGTATIQSIAGDVLTFTAALPSGNIALVDNAAGNSTAVQGSGANALTVSSAFGFAAGQVVTLSDQDVIDTQPVSAAAGLTLTPQNPFMQAPEPDTPWVYGQSAGAFPAKLFRVLNIKRKGDEKYTLDTIEYFPIQDDTPIITQTLGVPDSLAAISNLTAVEQYAMAFGANSGQQSQVAVSWQAGPNTVATQIWVARNEAGQPLSSEQLLAVVQASSSYVLQAPTGTILQIRAVGVDAAGQTAPYSTAPVITLTVQGAGQAPADITGLTGTMTSVGAALTWTAVAGAGVEYEIRYNADVNNTSWTAATLLYAGAVADWTDTQVRLGCYLVKALSAASVESVNAASWNYLLSSARVNAVGLVSGQQVSITLTTNALDSASPPNASVVPTLPAQTLQRADGTSAAIPQSGVQWTSDLAPGTTYYFYPYLAPYTYALGVSTNGAALPPTAADATCQAGASAGGNYPCGVLVVTTPSASGSSGSNGTSTGTSTNTGGTPPSGGRPVQQLPDEN